MIITNPLSEKVQDDRIRMVFGLTSNDPLPDPDDDTLHIYHKHLLKKLVFPFTAIHGEGYGHPERVKVIGLGDSDEESMIDEQDGILCEARLGGEILLLPLRELSEIQRKSNRQLIEDYCTWCQYW